MSDRQEQWLAERYWPGLTEAGARAMVAALHNACADLGGSPPVGLVASTWLPDDETLTSHFVGTRAAVVAAHQLAHTTFDRLTRAIDLPG